MEKFSIAQNDQIDLQKKQIQIQLKQRLLLDGQDMEPVTASELGRELLSYSSIKKRQGTGGVRFYEGVELK